MPNDKELEEAAQILGDDFMDLLKKNDPSSPLPNSIAVIVATPAAKSADEELDKKAVALADKEPFNIRMLALGASYDHKKATYHSQLSLILY